jgi:hypothetical protein
MSRSALFRMDDFLLKGAAYLGLGLGAFALVAASVKSTSGSGNSLPMAPLLAVAIAPIAMGFVGLQIRRREKRALALWRLIDREVEISSRDLLRDSDWTTPHLDRAIRDLNNAGVAYVVWDRKSQVVQNGRLRRSSLVVDECQSCGGKLSIKVTIGSPSAARCPYCDDPIDVALIAQEKARLIDELEVDRPESEATRSTPMGAGNFSVFIFLLLFGVFWPAALWYCFKHRNSLAELID